MHRRRRDERWWCTICRGLSSRRRFTRLDFDVERNEGCCKGGARANIHRGWGESEVMKVLNLLDKYASTFREMINSKVQSSDRSIRELLGLSKDTDWNFLTAAMDIIGDAGEAIGNVQRFGLSGPTKYNDEGERYLRLYGLLSAAYIQQRAVLTIYTIMNVPNLKKTKERCKELQLVALRHKLSAHGTDYKDAGALHAYVPVRVSLSDTSVTVARHATPMDQETIDLSTAIDTHTKQMIATMDAICEKVIGTLFKGHDNKRKEFTERLSDLRVERDGGWVMRVPKGAPKTIITVG
jgi:hypothetical protein